MVAPVKMIQDLTNSDEEGVKASIGPTKLVILAYM